jgi:hypothetical protein
MRTAEYGGRRYEIVWHGWNRFGEHYRLRFIPGVTGDAAFQKRFLGGATDFYASPEQVSDIRPPWRSLDDE